MARNGHSANQHAEHHREVAVESAVGIKTIKTKIYINISVPFRLIKVRDVVV